MCYECQTPYLAVLCHFVADLSAGTQKPHSKSIQNHSLTSLNYLICQMICIQTMNHLGKISCNCLGKKKKRSSYFSIFKGNTLFKFSFLFFSFPLFFLSVLGYWLECWPFLPLLTWIASAKPRFEFFLFLFPEMSLLFVFYLCFYHYPFLFCIFSAFSLSPWKYALQVL